MNTIADHTSADDHALERDLHCPLCDYNLRGLAEARCPECGGKFDWDELRDPSRRLHPYLFEHHPEQNVRSLLCTLLSELLPGRFWRTLLPVQPSRPRRLIGYWAIYMLLATVGAVAEFTDRAWTLYHDNVVNEAFEAAYYGGAGVRDMRGRLVSATSQEVNVLKAQYCSIWNYLDGRYPMPPSLRFFKAAAGHADNSMANWRGYQRDPVLEANIFTWLVGAIWPWTITGIMLIFRASMRKAAIRPVHLLRVGIYCGDLIFWIGWVWAAFVIAVLLAEKLQNVNPIAVEIVLGKMLMVVPALAMLLLTYRLGSAIGKYLRFRHAMAMAISAQVIFTLLVLQIVVLTTYA